MRHDTGDRIRVDLLVKALTYVIGVIALFSIAGHVGYLYSFIFLLLVAASAIFDYKGVYLFPRWALNTVAVFFILMIFLGINYENLIIRTLWIFIFLLFIKFLEEKKPRDYLQIHLISVFLLFGAALLSTDLIFLFFFVTLIFLLTVAIILLTYLTEEPSLSLGRDVIVKIISRSMVIFAVAIPLTIVFFIILPRPYSPFLKISTPGKKAITGFSEDVSLGEVSEIQEDTSTIFRVNMQKVDDDLLYWRGVVFDHFDGRSWSLSENRENQKLGRQSMVGEMVEQTIYLEPYNYRYLFALDRPVMIRRSRTSRVFTYSLSRNPWKRMRYEAVSFLSETVPESDVNEGLYLQLPDDISPRITDLTEGLSRGRDDRQTLDAFMDYFEDEEYKYSLTALPVSETPLEDFFFDYKYGNCEYFASSLAVMLRISGIPARVVGGYKGADYNEMGGYYLVQQRNAHVWVEAFIRDEGWVRADTTPAYREVLISQEKSSYLFRTQAFFDVINYFWNSLVIDYDLRQQFSFFLKIGSGLKRPGLDIDSSITEESPAIMIFLPVGIVVLLFAAYKLLRKRRPPELRVINRFQRRMKGYGYVRESTEGLEEFVLRVDDAGIRESAMIFIDEFQNAYYRDITFSSEIIKGLRSRVKDIRPS